MLFYLATLQSIPTDVYEAAAIDGGGVWRTFWKITFPLLKPAHFFVAVVSVIGALKIFDQAFIISSGSGGPADSTMTGVLYLYRIAISEFNFGYGAAVGVVLFLIIFSLTLDPAAAVRPRGDRLLMAEQEASRPHVAPSGSFARDERDRGGAASAIPPSTRSERARKRASRYVLMVALALFYLLPFVWTFSTSLKTQAESVGGLRPLAREPDPRRLPRDLDTGRTFVRDFFKNSAIFARRSPRSTSSSRPWAATRSRGCASRSASRSSCSCSATLMIPDQLRLVPVFLMMVDFPVSHWNLIATKEGYIFFGSSLALATNLFLMRQYFLTIPKDYEEAAKLDGAGYFKTYCARDAAARRAGARRGRDPHLPGHLERVLLGEPAARPEPGLGRWTVQIGLSRSSASSTRRSGRS